MSAGICGKRVGFEEIFGSSSPPPCSSSKRSRWSSYGSPIRSESGSEDTVSVLLQMFPALEPEFVETVLRNNNYKTEDAIESLGAFSSGGVDAQNESDSAVIGNCDAVPDQSEATCSQMWEEKIDVKNGKLITGCGNSTDGSKWVDLFVHEMMNATDLDDARVRAARILEAFEQSISAQTRISKQLEHASLKEYMQSLLNDNQILKRAVAIQHERCSEQEERTKGVQQLKHVLSQYQEQVRSLELNNYALKLHLQRAQGSSSMSGHSLPDIF
ncbi:Ubiquitin system component Cue [Quillaja saponaria]|uniref:Ubiquitin system component Cue n=1 Tax=Quillaja saponaria TaxID=32244 RepID=A0AAD7Q0G9_QUISA|nr:Ubiquitin system component Cue [Quillaja saponaria]